MNEPEFCCAQMKLVVISEEVPIVYNTKFREYGIRVLDGGTSSIELLHCPWCGQKPPASLRDRWFDELESRGIDPVTGDVPEEFLDDRWYTNRINR